jgi:hypothetical protein
MNQIIVEPLCKDPIEDSLVSDSVTMISAWIYMYTMYMYINSLRLTVVLVSDRRFKYALEITAKRLNEVFFSAKATRLNIENDMKILYLPYA